MFGKEQINSTVTTYKMQGLMHSAKKVLDVERGQRCGRAARRGPEARLERGVADKPMEGLSLSPTEQKRPGA